MSKTSKFYEQILQDFLRSSRYPKTLKLERLSYTETQLLFNQVIVFNISIMSQEEYFVFIYLKRTWKMKFTFYLKCSCPKKQMGSTKKWHLTSFTLNPMLSLKYNGVEEIKWLVPILNFIEKAWECANVANKWPRSSKQKKQPLQVQLTPLGFLCAKAAFSVVSLSSFS